MPTEKQGHCQVTLNDTHLFISGGYDSPETFILDVKRRSFTFLDNLPRGIYSGACGLLNHPVNGQGITLEGNWLPYLIYRNLGHFE